MNDSNQLGENSLAITVIVCFILLGFVSANSKQEERALWTWPADSLYQHQVQIRQDAINEFASHVFNFETYRSLISEVSLDEFFSSLVVVEVSGEWHAQSLETRQHITAELLQDWEAIAMRHNFRRTPRLLVRDSEGHEIVILSGDELPDTCEHMAWNDVIVKSQKNQEHRQ